MLPMMVKNMGSVFNKTYCFTEREINSLFGTLEVKQQWDLESKK
jgi:hypothetical protein